MTKTELTVQVTKNRAGFMLAITRKGRLSRAWGRRTFSSTSFIHLCDGRELHKVRRALEIAEAYMVPGIASEIRTGRAK